MELEKYFQQIAEEYGCTVEDLKGDPHSVCDWLVEHGVISQEEGWSDLGFSTVARALGVDVGY